MATADRRQIQYVGNYDLVKTIGQGQFGKVKLARHVITDEIVAIKIIHKSQLDAKAIRMISREVNVMKKLEHSNIIRLYEVLETEKMLFLVMEYASGGEVLDYIVAHGRLKEPEARRFFQQVIEAVMYCHANYVVHRDLKAENLLLDADRNVKIIDFGLSNFFTPGTLLNTFCGSPTYAAPELLKKNPYRGPEVDVWSSGVLLYVLNCGALPFDGEDFKSLFVKILSANYVLPPYISPLLADLLRRMLVVDPHSRITMAEVRQHPWVTNGDLPPPIVIIPKKDWTPEMLDEEVLQHLEAIGFSRDLCVRSIVEQKYDVAASTYFLFLKKKEKDVKRRQEQQEKKVALRRRILQQQQGTQDQKTSPSDGKESTASPQEAFRPGHKRGASYHIPTGQAASQKVPPPFLPPSVPTVTHAKEPHTEKEKEKEKGKEKEKEKEKEKLSLPHGLEPPARLNPPHHPHISSSASSSAASSAASSAVPLPANASPITFHVPTGAEPFVQGHRRTRTSAGIAPNQVQPLLPEKDRRAAASGRIGADAESVELRGGDAPVVTTRWTARQSDEETSSRDDLGSSVTTSPISPSSSSSSSSSNPPPRSDGSLEKLGVTTAGLTHRRVRSTADEVNVGLKEMKLEERGAPVALPLPPLPPPSSLSPALSPASLLSQSAESGGPLLAPSGGSAPKKDITPPPRVNRPSTHTHRRTQSTVPNMLSGIRHRLLHSNVQKPQQVEMYVGGDDKNEPRAVRGAISNSNTSSKEPEAIMMEICRALEELGATAVKDNSVSPFVVECTIGPVTLEIEVCQVVGISKMYYFRMKRIQGDYVSFKSTCDRITNILQL